MRAHGAASVTRQPPNGAGSTATGAAVQGLRACAVLLGVLLLAGCGGANSGGPVAWWHQLEGGRIAADRPPPPNANAPFPNLANIPPLPATTPAAVRSQIAAGLVADRANVAYGSDPGKQPPSVRLPLGPAQDSQSASMGVASAPPRAAPRAAVAAVGLPMPAAADNATMPAMAVNPPAQANLPGMGGITVPAPPPLAPPAAPPPAPAPVAAGPAVAVAFAPGSAALPPDAMASLRALATRRGGRTIQVAGFGDAAAADIATQAASLDLALARSRAIAVGLAQSGVPISAIDQESKAIGSGGLARIVE
jgi:hypothetical protein